MDLLIGALCTEKLSLRLEGVVTCPDGVQQSEVEVALLQSDLQLHENLEHVVSVLPNHVQDAAANTTDLVSKEGTPTKFRLAELRTQLAWSS